MKTDYTNYVAPWLGKTVRLMDHRLEELLEENRIEISKMQLFILKMVANKEGISQNELAMFAERDKSSLTRMINTLEKKNYVKRVPLEHDRRVNGIYLTARGLEIVKSARPLLNDFATRVEKGLSGEEIETTIRVLQKIQNNIHNL